MREAVDCFADFKVDKSVFCMFVEVVLLNGCLGENIDGHFHIFEAVHGRYEVEILDVKAEISGVFGTDDAVP